MTKEELEKEAEEYRESKRHKSFRADVGTVQINYESYLNNLQQAYLAGAEPREKQIQIDAEQIRALQKHNGELTDKVKELEKEVKEWKDKADLWCKTANLKDHNIMINKELEKENAELKSLKDVADLIRLNNSHIVAMAQLNNNNVALRKENAKLKAENQKWKDEWQEQVKKATDEGYARTLQTIQLTKAKELLKQFLNAKNGEDTYKAEWEAEQFLKETEK